jgi:hypothetical protein
MIPRARLAAWVPVLWLAAPPAAAQAVPDPAFLAVPLPALPPEAGQDFDLRDQVLGEHARKTATAHWQAYFQANTNRADILCLPGLVADRSTGAVWVWAWATGMNAGEPVEFFVINNRSGHGYESILTTAAAPSDLHRALEFLDLRPGWPANPARGRLWPKGDRVRLTVHALQGPSGEEELRALPIESYLRLTGPQPRGLAPTNHVFVGSVREPDPQNPGRNVYAADAFSPNAIASNFNLEPTVFDLPRQARKEAVYGTMVRAEEPALKPFQPAFLRLDRHPDFPPGSIPDLRWEVRATETGPRHRLLDGQGQELSQGTEPLPLLRAVAEARQRAQDLHLTLDLDLRLSSGAARDFARLIAPLDDGTAFKVDPAPAGQLFYRAFAPNEEFRDRAARPFQPWELHLTPAGEGAGWRARLVILEEKWAPDKIDPDLVETPLPIDGPAALLQASEGRDFLPGVLFIYGPASLPHAEAARWVEPLRTTFPVVYVLVD